MKILHTLPSADSSNSGPSYSVPRLCHSLATLDNDVELLTLGKPSTLRTSLFVHRRVAPDYSLDTFFGRLGRSRSMESAINAFKPDILHAHGLWMMPSVYPAEVARKTGKPFLLSPRGMMGPAALQFSRIKKQVFWQLWQKRAMEVVSCFHATAESECEDIRLFGLRQPVAIIPNGIDLPDLSKLSREVQKGSNRPYVLSLGRIHPKKALSELIAAWNLMRNYAPGWQLRIVGPDEGGHAAELQKQIVHSKLEREVSIEGPVIGKAKITLMRDAAVFVLPTLNENFAMTVAESLAAGTPVISTKGAPWAGLLEHRCGWWVEHGAPSIASALRQAVEMSPDHRLQMGENGRAWMKRDFGWDGIAEKMSTVYQWLQDGKTKPEFVRR